MAIDRTLSPFGDEEAINGATVGIDILNPESVTVETEDGGAVIVFGEDEDNIPIEFGSNLAEYLDENELARISGDLLSDYESDLNSRVDWEETYKTGLDLLGLKIEERTTPWPGACGVHHPLLAEAAVRFQSQSIMETFPAAGPVKTQIIGLITPEKEKQALRVKDDLNYFLTKKIVDFRSEHERMLFTLPLAGAAFKKVYYDPSLKRPVSMYVPAEDLIAPYGATSLESCPRYAHRMRKYPNEVRKLQVSGFYRDIDLGESQTSATDIQQAKDEISGEREVANDDRYLLLEYHAELDIEGFEDTKNGEATGIALPYVITIEKDSGQVLSIYRNWKENDDLKIKRLHFVQYDYIPGFGFYAFGLIHLIGGIAKSSTSILRQLVDAGTLSNLPGGLKSRGLRIKGDSTPIMPGEFRDADVASGNIRDSITFLPNKEPSQVLAALMGNMVEEGRRFASIADLQIGDANQQAPVGTTLALMERAMKVMSAVQARLHASLTKELTLLVDIIKNNMSGEYDYEVTPGATREQDYDGRIDVFPVTDPNAASMSQRVMQYQAALQLAAQAPQMYDLPALHRQMLSVLGLNEIEKIIPDTKDKKPKDPVSENMDILNGKPVQAFLYQDHEAHVAVHLNAMQDPKILQLVGQSPMATSIQAAAVAHINEHIAFQYRKEIEKQLGIALPAQNAELPEDIESELSRLIAIASGKLLQKDKAEAQQKQQQAQAEDPVIQAQKADIEIKKGELELKIKKLESDIAARDKTAEIERERIAVQDKQAAANASIQIAKMKVNHEESQKTMEAEQEKLALEAAIKIAGMKIDHAKKTSDNEARDKKLRVDTTIKVAERLSDSLNKGLEP